jgi:hypothetical protein
MNSRPAGDELHLFSFPTYQIFQACLSLSLSSFYD